MHSKKNITPIVSQLLKSKHRHYLLLLFLLALTLWLYGPTLNIPLLSDDYVWLFDIVPFDNLKVFFERHFSVLDREYRYRPLMPTMVRACYAITGPAPFCMHLSSLTLHFLNTLLVGALAYALTKKKPMAWAAAFFFAAYFAHVENVAWMSDMGNLLAAFFMLITATLFIWAIEQKNYWLYGLSLLAFALAMMSKESALALGPILLIWGGIYFLQKNRVVNRQLIFLAAGSYVILLAIYLFFINKTGLSFALSGQNNYAYRFNLTTLRNTIYYPLNFIRSTEPQVLERLYQNIFDLSRTQPEMGMDTWLKMLTLPDFIWVIGGTLVFWLGILWLLLWQRKAINWLTITWLILGILPVVFIGGHSERHLYVASIGLSLLAGQLFLGGQISNRTITFIIRGLFVVTLLFNIHWTQLRVRNWQMTGQSAGQVIATVMQTYPNLTPDSQVWFVGLPDELNGVHFFRHGIREALAVEIGDPHRRISTPRVSRVEELPYPMTEQQYAFIFKDRQLLDLTPEYRN